MTITYIAPCWPMLCASCGEDLGYWIPGLAVSEHRCTDCWAKETAEACLNAGLAVLRVGGEKEREGR